MSSAPSDTVPGSEAPVKLRQIVVGVNGKSEGRDAAALAGALHLATGADALLVAVLSDPLILPLAGANWKELHMTAETKLAETRDALVPDARVAIETDVSIARALGRVAARERADLIVVGSSSDADAGRVAIGKRTRQLIGDAQSSLAVAPRGLAEGGTPRIARIGVGYDGGPESEAALALASAIARGSGAVLAVRAVVEDMLPAFGLVGPGSAQLIGEWDSLVASNVETLRARAAEAARDTAAEATVEVQTGHSSEALLEFSKELDLIVVGSRRWGTVARLILGSTGEALVRGAACPIIIVPRADT
jgi:nucleotide-binding universal stress UspA family protein